MSQELVGQWWRCRCGHQNDNAHWICGHCWMLRGTTNGVPETCQMCLEPCHWADGALVHDFTGKEKCTYRAYL